MSGFWPKLNTLNLGWSSEADLMKPGSGLEQLSHFADQLTNRKSNIARHKSFAAIPSKSELETHTGTIWIF